MQVYQTSDGYKFYVQSNGVVTDTPDINDCDLNSYFIYKKLLLLR